MTQREAIDKLNLESASWRLDNDGVKALKMAINALKETQQRIDGYKAGFDKGYAIGRECGSSSGYQLGYEKGSEEGKAEAIDKLKEFVPKTFCAFCSQEACEGGMLGSIQECQTISVLRDVFEDVEKELKG